MPNRILKESICTSENLLCLSADAEVMFYRLIVRADDFGRYYASPSILASMLYPQKPPSEDAINRRLSELVKADLIEIYAGTDGKPYLKLKSWETHQRKRADKSKFPDPKREMRTSADIRGQLLSNVAVNDNDNVNVNDISTPACACEESDDLTEETDKETQPKPINSASGSINGAAPINRVPINDTVSFEDFWEKYPRKIAKSDAQKAWNKLKPSPELACTIISAIEHWKKTEQWQEAKGKYIPYPATFIRRRDWESENESCADSQPHQLENESYDFDEFLAVAQKRLWR